jgi:hypothetical protein
LIGKQRVARIDASPVLVDHQGPMNPLRFLMQVVRRANRRLDEVNVDDTELEDELEPLYAHGNKMDSGPFGTGMSGGVGPGC